jgi:hypothetical protein
VSVCVCGGDGGGRGCDPHPLPLAGPVTIYAKTTVYCSPVSSMGAEKSCVVCSVRCEPLKRNKDFPLFEGAIRHVNVQYHVTLRDLLCPRCSLSYPSPRLLSESLMYSMQTDADNDNMYTRVATRAELQLHVVATRSAAFLMLRIYRVCWVPLSAIFEALLRVVVHRKKAFGYSRPKLGCHLPNSPWAGIMTSYKIIPAQGEFGK